MYKPKLISVLKDEEYSKEKFIKDFMAGVIVAIIALPLSVALGISSGVSPDKGLITAIIAGLIISLMGGSRVQIGGPTGAFVVIIYGIIEKHGIDGLIIATFMAGVILLILGALKLGSLIKYIPYPITVGFTAGIALTLFATQLKDFFGFTIDKVPSEFIPKVMTYAENLGTLNIASLALGVFSLALIIYWPKINKKIPGSLVALIAATVIALVFKLPVATIGSQFGEISSSIPVPALPNFDLNTIKSLIGPAFTIAILAAIESLLSAVVADGMINDKHDSNAELIGQGLANIGSSLFGGIPATGAIARTAANIKNGGKTPIAGIIHAITLLIIMLVLMPLVKYVPLTTLAAILMVVSYNMSEIKLFKKMLKAPKNDVIILVTTFLLTVVFDLVVAIEVGMIIAMALFMKKMAEDIEIREMKEARCFELADKDIEISTIGERVLVYEIRGPLFFGAAESFMNTMRRVNKSVDVLILRMKHTKTMDVTAYDTIKKIVQRCNIDNIQLIFTEFQEQPKELMKTMGMIDKIGEDRFTSRFTDGLCLAEKVIKEQGTTDNNKTA